MNNSFHSDESLKTEEDSFEFEILEQISKSKFPIFKCKIGPDSFAALKFFPYFNGKISKNYKAEAKCATLNHPNVIKIFETFDSFDIDNIQGSAILMELADCDFVEFIAKSNFKKDEKLARTYFRQLISGLEYLHANGISHLDLKPENLLLGKDNKLKIADFDLCHFKGEDELRGCGTKNFRAPELVARDIMHPRKADLYSAGIVLFVLGFGYMPYSETDPVDGQNLFTTLGSSPRTFIEIHTDFNKKIAKRSELIDLFVGLTMKNPELRFNFKQVKSSAWFEGSVYEENN